MRLTGVIGVLESCFVTCVCFAQDRMIIAGTVSDEFRQYVERLLARR